MNTQNSVTPKRVLSAKVVDPREFYSPKLNCWGEESSYIPPVATLYKLGPQVKTFKSPQQRLTLRVRPKLHSQPSLEGFCYALLLWYGDLLENDPDEKRPTPTRALNLFDKELQEHGYSISHWQGEGYDQFRTAMWAALRRLEHEGYCTFERVRKTNGKYTFPYSLTRLARQILRYSRPQIAAQLVAGKADLLRTLEEQELNQELRLCGFEVSH